MGEKNMIEDALFQIKNLEESLKKNAQGILSSTMRKEINSLVKESLMEQEEIEDPETAVITQPGMEDPNMMEPGMEDPSMMEPGMEGGEEEMTGMEPEEDETIDMRDASDAEVIRVFKAMGDNDGVVVTRDNNIITLTDDDDEYIIKLNESMGNFRETAFDLELEEMYEDGTKLNEFEYEDEEDEEDDDYGLGIPDDMPAYKTKYRYSDEDAMEDEEDEDEDDMEDYSFEDEEEEEDDDMEDYSFEDEEEEDDDEDDDDEDDYMPMNKLDMGIKEKGMLNRDPMAGRFKSNRFDDEDMEDDEEVEEIMYEIEMNGGSMNQEFDEMYEDAMLDDLGEMDNMFEDFGMEMDDMSMEDIDDDLKIYESKKSKKSSKGLTGKGPKFKYGQVTDYKMPKQKEGTKGVGMGKAKFTYNDGENLDGEFRPIKRGKKVETKEASRTYGSGRSFGRGLPKPKAAPRHLKEEVIELRTKNDEYRKALDLFRTKLNEVAVFNSNLAYATRLFTEQSTTKQEKINILRRFDDVETLKESKNLYRVVKSELLNNSLTESVSLNESIERTVNKTASSGSAVSLIESKTYENPQFLRMKDLMSKL
jgi:hypothetical protein